MAVDDTKLKTVLTDRLGDAQQAKHLARAYLDGVEAFAFDRTTGTASVPTSLTGERVALLLEVSKGIGRLIDSREIECLLRVTPSAARRLQLELRATHEDSIRPFIYRWALTNASKRARGKHVGVTGTAVAFATEAHLEAFAAEAERTGVRIARDVDENTQHWVLYVADGFDFGAYGL